MSTKRRAGGGRKPTILVNPFVITTSEDTENILWLSDEIDSCIEDILIGCVRVFDSIDKSKVGKYRNRSYISWYKLYKVYRNCDVITRQIIQDYLGCSLSTAKRYVRVIKFANPFLCKLLN